MDNPEHREHWTQDTERRQTKQKTQHRKYKDVKHRPHQQHRKYKDVKHRPSPTTQKIQKCEAPTLTNNTENTKM